MADSQESGDAAPNHLVIAQLSKTRMCIKFSKGACKDSECRFAHSSEELRVQPDLSKTAICRAFARGKCSDTDCKYAHGETELRGSPTVYKTQLCNFHARGHCKKGDKCRHAHGRKELRAFPEQIPALPPNKESGKVTPKRGARQTQVQASPSSPSDDIPKNLASLFDEAFQTPQKSRKPGAAQEDSPSEPAQPMKVMLPEGPVAPLPYYPAMDVQGLMLPQSPGLPSPWQMQTPPDMALRAAAAAAMSAHQHTMAANAASSAAMTWAHMHQNCLTPFPGLQSEPTLQELQWSGQDSPSKHAESKPASDDRRWVL